MTSFVEINRVVADNAAQYFMVYCWSAHYDSGFHVGSFDCRDSALDAANAFADLHGIEVQSAQIVPLITGAK